MDNEIKKKLMLVYNTLNLVEVKGASNLINLANSITLLKEIIETSDEVQN